METKQGNMMKPARYPNTFYYGIQPTISSVAADMDDMSMDYPTQSMFDAMTDRAYDEVTRMYPEEMQSQATGSVHSDQPYEYHRRRPILRDLVAILLLNELLRRRRRY